jgi:hypothetical protein
MNPAGAKKGNQPASSSSSPPPNLNAGAWTKNPDGSWTWIPGATPDPNLVSQYGNGALTNAGISPSGLLNHGAWTPVHGGGWHWTWGANPDPNLVKKYGIDKLTNWDKAPDGAQGPGNKDSKDHPLSPDVVPPTVNDIWDGIAPDVTGQLPPPSDEPPGKGQQHTGPPVHTAYWVAPGSIRDAESALLTKVDDQISQYDVLKTYVGLTHSQNIYYWDDNSNTGVTEGQLSTTQDGLLQNIGDTIELCGQYIGMLNRAAQNYAHADIGSFFPPPDTVRSHRSGWPLP